MIKTKEKSSKLLNIIIGLLLSVAALWCVATLSAVLFSAYGGKLFGLEMRIILSSSMEKNPNFDVKNYRIKDIPAQSLILIELVPKNETKAQKWYAKLKEGDVLTFNYKIAGENVTITHRIRNIAFSESGYEIVLAGDCGDGTSTQTIGTADIVGKVIFDSYFLGKIIYAMCSPISSVASALIIFAAARLMYDKRRRPISRTMGITFRKKGG